MAVKFYVNGAALKWSIRTSLNIKRLYKGKRKLDRNFGEVIILIR